MTISVDRCLKRKTMLVWVKEFTLCGNLPDKYDKYIVLIFSQWLQCSMLLLVIFGDFNSKGFSYCNNFSSLHAKHFEIWKNILWNWWVNCFIAWSIKWCNILGAHNESIFPFMQYFFYSRKLCFLRSPYLLLISFDPSGKTTVVFFLKISHLNISLNKLNSSDWLLKRWRWIFLK